MVIKIPSKNIYEIDNPKVRDNLVNKVDIEQSIVVPKNEFDVSVHTETFNVDIDLIEGQGKEITQHKDALDVNAGASTSSYKRVACGTKYEIKYKKVNSILIPKEQTDKIVTRVYNFDDDGNPKVSINWTMIQKVFNGKSSYNPKQNEFLYDGGRETQTTEDSITFQSLDNIIDVSEEVVSFEDKSDITNLVAQQGIYCSSKKKIANLKNSISLYSSNWSPSTISIDAKEEVPFYDATIVVAKEIEIDGIKYYQIPSFDCVAGIDVTFMSCIIEGADWLYNLDGYFPAVKTRFELFSKSISVTVNGDTIGIDLTDGTVTYGSGNKPHSLTANELLQDSGKVKTKDESGNDIQLPITKHLANNVLKQYAVGKETATLLCDINEYYDENGDLVISTEKSGLPMTFNIGDEVIPYVFGANGQDKPMSLYRDGNPKVFRIIGTNTIYDGAVWQELTLQEVTKG